MKYINGSLLLIMLLCITCISTYAQESKPEKGELYFVNETTIAPENYDAFIEYNKAYKKLADEKNGPDYYVIFANNTYRFGGSFGKEISGLADFYKKWGEWNTTPEIKALNEKYSYVAEYYNMVIWRYASELSYSLDNSNENTEFNYRRYTEYYVKPNKVEDLKIIIKGYIEEYKTLSIDEKIATLWNVMGREGPCLLVVEDFKDRATWANSVKEYSVKTKDNKKIDELEKRFNATLRKSERYEGFPVRSLSHSNESEKD